MKIRATCGSILFTAVICAHHVYAREPYVDRVISLCDQPFPADVLSLVDDDNPDLIVEIIVKHLLTDNQMSRESHRYRNGLRLLSLIGGHEYRITNSDAIRALLVEAAPGMPNDELARAALVRVNTDNDVPAINTAINAYISHALADPEMLGLLGMIRILKPVLSEESMSKIHRIAYDSAYSIEIARAVVNEQWGGFASHDLDAKMLENIMRELRANAMMLRLEYGKLEVDSPEYAGLDPAGRALAGHMLLLTLFPDSQLWNAADNKTVLYVISIARNLFMDALIHTELEASPVGLWMICAGRQDLSIDARRAILQAMLDNAHATQNPEIIAIANHAIADSGFDPSLFVPKP